MIASLDTARETMLARRERDRLAECSPSQAAPLTDEDLAIFQARIDEKQFEFFVKASYLEYADFFMLELQKAIEKCEKVLDA